MQCQPNLSSTTSTKVLQKLRKRPSSAVRLVSGSGIGPIDDVDGRMEWQRARLLAGNANDLAPCHDYIVNHLASGKDERDPVGTHADFGERLGFGSQPLRKDVPFGGVQ